MRISEYNEWNIPAGLEIDFVTWKFCVPISVSGVDSRRTHFQAATRRRPKRPTEIAPHSEKDRVRCRFCWIIGPDPIHTSAGREHQFCRNPVITGIKVLLPRPDHRADCRPSREISGVVMRIGKCRSYQI